MQSPLQPSSQRKNHRAFGSLLTLFVLVGVGILVWLNHQYILDSVSYYRFEPSAEVAEISKNAGLTDSGKFNFYAAQPSVDATKSFNSKCDRREENTAILGCYVGNKIYIYGVTDIRLDGIKEVTATHEMLHAVYQRLSNANKIKVDNLVEAELVKLQHDPSYADRLAFYARTEPGERDNELHSIIGTEIADISPELEAHYSKYFNRSKIVGYYAKYNGEFTRLSNEAERTLSQLKQLSTQINSMTASFNQESETLKNDKVDIKNRVASGGFTSQAQLDKVLQSLNTRIDTNNAQLKLIYDLRAQFDTLQKQYEAVATESSDLYKSIDSTLAPTPRV